MKHRWSWLLLSIVSISVFLLISSTETKLTQAAKADHPPKGNVVPGIEVFLEKHLDWVKNKRVGLITNPTGINRQLESDINLLYQNNDVHLTALFGPEHGIRGDREAGEYVESYIDEETGLPVYSLYGPTWKPTEEMVEDVDVLLFDIQDIGSNVYTYIYTLGFAMEAAAEYDKELIVLDRPNAIGGDRVEGPVRDADSVSFMGRFLLPVRHGMTVGELATMWNHEYGLGIDLKVAKMKGWKRTMHYEDTGLPWIQPSPNIPTPTSADLYAGTELVEDTNLTTGLGTTKPFELLGAPWLNAEDLVDELRNRDIPGVRFRSAYFTPQFSKYKGELVAGVQVHVDDPQAINLVALGLHLVDAMRDQNPGKFTIDTSYNQLIGDANVREMILQNQPVDEIIESWEDELEYWKDNVRNKYLLYPPYPNQTPPYKKQSVLGILPLDIEVAPGEKINLTVHGVDENGEDLDIAQNEVDWQIEGDIGRVENGVFIPTEQGEGTLIATYNGISVERNVTVDTNIIKNIRYGVHGDFTRTVFDLNKNTQYDIEKENRRLILHVPHAENGGELEESGEITISNSPVISKIEYQFQEGEFKADLYLKEESVIHETPYFSNRIVIDVMH
ncbi:exo-beta-N-acetylmuramidase NamZ family protein [Virgibacillus dakarensis]|uniref:exo-beta-N-acetylmuramidase NamZ family protein n=1 Tax=Virgibacillus dakarensis TaxID=1917889 RepID=UPI000B4358AD|nr:DUF1343 domain-containing protein [Virgibacillus dakarensis]